MMKKLFILIAFASVLSSCEHKELWYGDTPVTPEDRQAVNVIFNWPVGATKPTSGMRVNLFSLNTQPDFGRADISVDGGTLQLPEGAEYMALCYNYHGNQMLFSDQDDSQQIRVSCAELTRSTYSRSYPSESTHVQPDADIFSGKTTPFPVQKSATPLELIFNPVNVVKTYTFVVENVQGAEFITDVRGAISGMSNGFNLSAQTYFQEPITVFFAASVDRTGGRITGSFRTFSRQDITNIFTLEILFPSNDGRIIQKSYDVTPQIGPPTNSYHIYIADSEIVVPDESGQSTNGWGVEVDDWDRVPVPL